MKPEDTVKFKPNYSLSDTFYKVIRLKSLGQLKKEDAQLVAEKKAPKMRLLIQNLHSFQDDELIAEIESLATKNRSFTLGKCLVPCSFSEVERWNDAQKMREKEFKFTEPKQISKQLDFGLTDPDEE